MARPSLPNRVYSTFARVAARLAARHGGGRGSGRAEGYGSSRSRGAVERLEGRRLLSVAPAIVPWAYNPQLPLTLVDATSGGDLGALADGSVVDLGLTGSKLNVRAEPFGDVASVAFAVDGKPVRTESDGPYTLAGDARGNYNGWTPSPGDHTLTVTPYSGANGKGTAGRAVTVRFTVVGTDASPTPVAVDSSPVPLPRLGSSPGTGPTGKKWVAAAGTASQPGAPEPVINVLGAAGVASHPVHVNALDSKLSAGSPITTRYEWDFGDPSGKYNVLPGWNAGHVYDNPGTYTVTLKITDEAGRTSTASTTVEVLPDNRRTIYVDAKDGSDNNAGLSPGDAIRTPARANALLKSGTRVLFRRGHTFDTFDWINVNVPDVYLGAYGDGDKPVLRVQGKNALYITRNAVHTVVEGLAFDSPHAVKGTFADKIEADAAMFVGGTNVAVRNCTFLNLDDAINTNPDPTGVLVQDNDAPLDTGIRGYFYWGEGTDAVILGNRAANSTREHNIRLSGSSRVLVAYNDLTNLNRQKVDRQDYSKGTVQVQRGSYAYVANNTLRDGPLRAGPRGGGTEPSDTTTEWVVFENNRVSNYQVDIYPGLHHLMIRNNVFTNKDRPAIALNPTDSEGRGVSDIQVLNNTGINNGYTGQFLRTNGATPDGTITLGNNLYVAPNLSGGGYGTAPVYVSEKDLTAFKSIFNNVWPVPATMLKYGQGGINWVWPTYSGQQGFKGPSEWAAYDQVSGDVFRNVPVDDAYRPAGGGADVGRPAGAVPTDLYGTARPAGGTYTAGAVQG